MRQLTVPPEAAGERLDVFLAGEAGSRAAAQRWIDGGLVEVDGRRQPKRHVLRGGERITLQEVQRRAPEAVTPARFEVAWEDEHLVVIDKPAGVVVHPGRGNERGTLAEVAGGVGGPPERPGIVHRLDRDTSGLLVVARSEAAYQTLSQAIRDREVTREYLALVQGRPPSRRGTIDAPLGRDRHHRTRMSTDTDEPRDAVTHFEVEQSFPDSTLLRVRLETGRTHQIRAHLQAIGHPVLGDPEYGVPLKGLRRQFLHACRLAFAHPITGEPVDVSSPLPDDLAAAMGSGPDHRR
jgi:23S rRNA pseudouridine1911/1915/1917 synthase